MKITVASVEGVKERISKSSGRPYKLWSFVDVEGNRFDDIYLGINELPNGMEVELDRTEKGWEAKKPDRPTAKTFKADPDKLKQDFTLEVARNLSIQRQVAYKGTIDYLVARMQIAQEVPDQKKLDEFFDWSMTKLSNKKPADDLPTDEEVDNIDLDEVPV